MKTAEDLEDPFKVWVVYFNPKDFPDLFVLRAQWPQADGSVVCDPIARTATTLEKIRGLVPPGLIRIERDPADDPVIVEYWI